MSRSVPNLELPDDVYDYVRRTAQGMKQPVEQALVTLVRAATPSLDHVPAKYRSDLEALQSMSDEALWSVLRTRLSAAQQRQSKRLLEKNERGLLSARERQALDELRVAADRLMLERSYAAVLLKCRGHRLPKMEVL